MTDARKTMLVDRFQSKLAYRVGLYWLIFTITLFNLLFGWRLLKEGRGDLWQQFTATVYDNIPLFLCFAVVVPWIGWDVVRFANRVVGPLVRFRRTMQAVTASEPVKPIRLRKDDFLTEVQDDFNAMLTALEQRHAVQIDRTVEPASTAGR